MIVDDSREPKRLVILACALAGTIGMALWMAIREPLRLGTLWGTSIAFITVTAWVAWSIPPRGNDPVSWRTTSLGRRGNERLPAAVFGGLAVLVLAVGAAIGGYEQLPWTILAALVCLVPPAMKRPGLAVMIVIAAVYLPLLGTTSLWDPWETHYGEVAREILARNDWISLWWAQDKWFWSKPALLFWMEALTMGVLGVDFMPDANPTHPEWALRVPTIAMTLAALAMIYATVRRAFGTRAAPLATLVVATMPQFFFISHQAITDLPLVAAISMAACALLLAMLEDPSTEARSFRVGRLEVSLQHLVVFALIAVVLPQAVYLISRNLSWIENAGLVAHPDRFLYGSAGNVDVPGNPNPRDQLPHVRGLLGQPFLQGILWLGTLGWLVQRLRNERRTRTLWMIAFYFFSAIAFMLKGLAGLAIPGAAALFYLIASRRWKLLGEGQLHVSLGVLVVIAVSLPWYVAMYVRHGGEFLDRLLIHDHINRLAAGVHGDTGTIEYFLRQLGYAAFPWIGLVPLAFLAVPKATSYRERSDQREMMLFLSMWFLSSFVLFSAMVTKYHHYLLPAIVPAGILIGIVLAEVWGPKRPSATLLAASAGLFFAVGVAAMTGDLRGVVPAFGVELEDWVLRQPRPSWAWPMIASGAVLAVVARRMLDAVETELGAPRWNAAVGVALIIGACILAFVGRDLSWMTAARPQGNERLIHLFVYNYERPWPVHLDYRAPMTGFAIAAALAVAFASLARWRAVAVRALAGIAVVFCVWGLNVYMTDVAAHWGQRDLAARYYAERSSAEEPLLAWQMNWKGENFYTGNRVHVFAETDNERIRKWFEQNEGRRVYVVLEHKRLSRFERLVEGRAVRALSTPRDNNKYLLVTLEI